MTTELKPCPFCGSGDIGREPYRAFCRECDPDTRVKELDDQRTKILECLASANDDCDPDYTLHKIRKALNL
jgi:hypothetical protein